MKIKIFKIYVIVIIIITIIKINSVIIINSSKNGNNIINRKMLIIKIPIKAGRKN